MRINFNFSTPLRNNSNNQEPNKNKAPKFAIILIVIGIVLFLSGMITTLLTIGNPSRIRVFPVTIILCGIGFSMIFAGIIATIFSSIIKGKANFGLPTIQISNENDESTKEKTTGYEVFRCPSCGAVIEHDAKECSYCGSDVREKNN